MKGNGNVKQFIKSLMVHYINQWVKGCGKDNCGNPFCKCCGPYPKEVDAAFSSISLNEVTQTDLPRVLLNLTKISASQGQFWVCTSMFKS